MILKENIDVLLFILGWIGILWVFVLYVVVVQYVCGVGVENWTGMFSLLCGTGVVCVFSNVALECCLRFLRYRVVRFLFHGVLCVFVVRHRCVFRDILKNSA